MEYNILDYKENSPEINSVFCEYSNLKKMFLFDFSKGNITEYNYIETFEWKDVAFIIKQNLFLDYIAILMSIFTIITSEGTILVYLSNMQIL